MPEKYTIQEATRAVGYSAATTMYATLEKLGIQPKDGQLTEAQVQKVKEYRQEHGRGVKGKGRKARRTEAASPAEGSSESPRRAARYAQTDSDVHAIHYRIIDGAPYVRVDDLASLNDLVRTIETLKKE